MKKDNTAPNIKISKLIRIFIITFVVTGSGWWFDYVIAFFGDSWNLTKNDRLTKVGQIISLLVMIGAILFACIQEIIEYRRSNLNEKEIYTLNNLLSKEKKYQHFVNSEMSTLYKYRISNKTPLLATGAENAVNFFDHTEEQLKRIQETIEKCTKECLNIYYGDVNRDVYVGILYSFPNSQDSGWYWTPQSNRRGAKADQLINDKSIFRKLLDEGTPYEIFNSKKKAHESGWYSLDSNDHRENLNGSIACYKISLKNGDNDCLVALIGISTYQQPFVSHSSKVDEHEVAQRLLNDVVNEFAEQLKLELCNLRIKEIHQKRNAINAPQ